jgi:predicted HTH transcriptional regulator
MKPEISEKEIEEILGKNASPHEIILRRIRNRQFREFLKFVIITVMKDDFIATRQVMKKFGVEQEWAGKNLSRLVHLGLLKSEPIMGSNMIEYKPVKGRDGDPVIFKYYTDCKKLDKGEM